MASDAYALLVASMRAVADRLRESDPTDAVARDATVHLQAAAALLRRAVAPEDHEPSMNHRDLPGRGNPMLPPLVLHECDGAGARGTVVFYAAFRGRAAVHGGAVGSLFDEALGQFVSAGGTPARTAYLHVNYRRLTPVGVPLRVVVALDRQDGCKVFASAVLYDGDVPVADAEGLWVLATS